MSTSSHTQAIVQEILKRLAERMGGTRETLLVVVTGATVGLEKTIAELQNLILRGFTLRLVFSDMGEHLTGEAIRSGLKGYPYWEHITHEHWFTDLRNSAAVLVPLLSVNTLSKLALLIADNQAGNLLLHALFSGKPLVLANDGVCLNADRIALGFGSGNEALHQTINRRLQAVENLGATVTHLDGFADQISASALFSPAPCSLSNSQQPETSSILPSPTANNKVMSVSKAVISGGDIQAARTRQAVLSCLPSALITPLAQEIATRYGVEIRRSRTTATQDGELQP